MASIRDHCYFPLIEFSHQKIKRLEFRKKKFVDAIPNGSLQSVNCTVTHTEKCVKCEKWTLCWYFLLIEMVLDCEDAITST